MVKFRGNNRVDKSSSSIRSKKLPDGTDILQDNERGGNCF